MRIESNARESVFQRIVANKWTPYIALLAATLVVWIQTVGFQFVWDDNYFIRDLQSIRSLKNIPGMFYRLDAQATLPEKFLVFRPIRTAHYALLYWLGHSEMPQPWLFHLANVLWHGATAMMLFAAMELLLARLYPDWTRDKTRWWSFFVACGFAIHPVVSEVVCWAKSFDDILAAFFTLATLRELLKAPEDRSARWRGLMFFTLAVYGKESAVPFAVIPFLILRGMHKLNWKAAVWRTGEYCAVALVYVVHRHLILGRSSQTSPLSGMYAQTLLDMFPVVTKYFRLLWGMPPFCIDYNYMKGGYSLASPEVIVGFVLLAALIGAGVLAWTRHGLRLLGFGLAWTGLFLLPVSNLLPMMQYMAERFLYLPLIGWLMAIAALGALLPKQPIARLLGLVLCIVWSFAAWQRSWIWKDEVTLFVSSYVQGPHQWRVEQNAVAAIMQLPVIQRVVTSDGKGSQLEFHQADPAAQAEALRVFEQASQMFPTNCPLLSGYGVTLALSGHPDQALPILQKVTELSPANPSDWLNYGRAAMSAGDLTKARSAATAALKLTPENPAVFAFQTELEWNAADYPAALAAAQKWRSLVPNEDNARWISTIEAKISASKQP